MAESQCIGHRDVDGTNVCFLERLRRRFEYEVHIPRSVCILRHSPAFATVSLMVIDL